MIDVIEVLCSELAFEGNFITTLHGALVPLQPVLVSLYELSHVSMSRTQCCVIVIIPLASRPFYIYFGQRCCPFYEVENVRTRVLLQRNLTFYPALLTPALFSGVVAEKLNFSFSTTYIALGFLLQTVLTVIWAGFVWRTKKHAKLGYMSVGEKIDDERTPILSGSTSKYFDLPGSSGERILPDKSGCPAYRVKYFYFHWLVVSTKPDRSSCKKSGQARSCSHERVSVMPDS